MIYNEDVANMYPGMECLLKDEENTNRYYYEAPKCAKVDSPTFGEALQSYGKVMGEEVINHVPESLKGTGR